MNVRLMVQSGAKRRQTFQMSQDELVIGRRSGSTIRIPSSEVSRQHCRFFKDDDVLMVEDLNSINGTLLNEETLHRPAVVRPGDVVQVGPVRFRVEYELSEEAEERINRPVEVLMEVEELETFEDEDEVLELEALELEEDEDEPVELDALELEGEEELGPIELDDDDDLIPMDGDDEDLPALDVEEEEEDWSLPLDLDDTSTGGSRKNNREDEVAEMDSEEEDAFRNFLDNFDED